MSGQVHDQGGAGPAGAGSRRYLIGGLALLLAVVAAGVGVMLVRDGTLGSIFGRDEAPPGTVAYQLHGGEQSPVTVYLEVAATPEQRQKGLSQREELPQGRGMVFLFPSDTDGAFWMKDTLVPLSIAFMTADGRVVDVLEMTPCEADPCPVYAPGGTYRYAVELPAGAFAEAGVEAGDRVTPVEASALPAAS